MCMLYQGFRYVQHPLSPDYFRRYHTSLPYCISFAFTGNVTLLV